jgi:hypothetical protein
MPGALSLFAIAALREDRCRRSRDEGLKAKQPLPGEGPDRVAQGTSPQLRSYWKEFEPNNGGAEMAEPRCSPTVVEIS